MVFRNLPDHLDFPPNWVITDAEARGPKTFTASQILAESSNIGTDTIAKLVGPASLEHWIYRYGLGKRTALGLPGESPGMVTCRSRSSPVRRWVRSRSARASA